MRSSPLSPGLSSACLAATLALGPFAGPALADEIWVAPAKSGADTALGRWAVTEGGDTRFNVAVPASLIRFVSAKIVLIGGQPHEGPRVFKESGETDEWSHRPPAPDPSFTYDLYLSLSRDGERQDFVTDARRGLGPVTVAPGQLAEVDVSEIFPAAALAGIDYVTLRFRAIAQGERARPGPAVRLRGRSGPAWTAGRKGRSGADGANGSDGAHWRHGSSGQRWCFRAPRGGGAERAAPRRHWTLSAPGAALPLQDVPGWLPDELSLVSQSGVIEVRVGTSDTIRKVPGNPSFGAFVFERAVTADMKLYQWRHGSELETSSARRHPSAPRPRGPTPFATVTLREAWPSRYEIIAYPDGTLAERVTITAEVTTYE